MCLFATPSRGPRPRPQYTHTHRDTRTLLRRALSWRSDITDNLVGLLCWQRTFIVCHVPMALYSSAKRLSLCGLAWVSLCVCVCRCQDFWPFARPTHWRPFMRKWVEAMCWVCYFSHVSPFLFFSFRPSHIIMKRLNGFLCAQVWVSQCLCIGWERVYRAANIFGYWFRAAIS